MSRYLIAALFCTSAIACTSATKAKHTTAAASPIVLQDLSSGEEPIALLPQDQIEQDLYEELAKSREQNLVRLKQYALAGAFPRNQVSPGMRNVFRDNQGHLCAVANLIHIDGHSALIDTTATNDNFILLSEVKSGPLLDWVLASGFTQEEIGMIQEPYMGEFDQQEVPIAPKPELATFREQEIKRVRSVLLEVHQRISANTSASLKIAVSRKSSPSKLAESTDRRFSQPPS